MSEDQGNQTSGRRIEEAHAAFHAVRDIIDPMGWADGLVVLAHAIKAQIEILEAQRGASGNVVPFPSRPHPAPLSPPE